MRPAVRTLCMFALVALPLAAAPVPKKKTTDVELIQGLWNDGRGGDTAHWHFLANGEGGFGAKKNPQAAKYRLDTTTDPKQFDWSQNGGKTWFLGIYELDGDTLKIALAQGGTGERPDEFGGKNPRYQYFTMTRVKE